MRHAGLLELAEEALDAIAPFAELGVVLARIFAIALGSGRIELVDEVVSIISLVGGSGLGLQALVSAWILVLIRPETGPDLGHPRPFFLARLGRALMRPHDGRVDHQPFRSASRARTETISSRTPI